jgi:co-chaperonin GroES (HSP10)
MNDSPVPECLRAPVLPVRACPGKILVFRDVPETQSKAGIIIPANAQAKPNTGVVTDASDCKLVVNGDRILFPSYEGSDVTVNEQSITILDPACILAIFN